MRAPSDFDEAVRRGVRYGQRVVVIHIANGAAAEDTRDSSGVPDGIGVTNDRTDENVSVTNAAPALVGFVVSKAVGNAVTRNLVKRRMRAIVRDEISGIPPGTKLVIRALPAAASADFDQLRGQLIQGLNGAIKKARVRSRRGDGRTDGSL